MVLQSFLYPTGTNLFLKLNISKHLKDHELRSVHATPEHAVMKSSLVNPLPNPLPPKWVIIISLLRDPKYRVPLDEQPATMTISSIGIPPATSLPTRQLLRLRWETLGNGDIIISKSQHCVCGGDTRVSRAGVFLVSLLAN